MPTIIQLVLVCRDDDQHRTSNKHLPSLREREVIETSLCSSLVTRCNKNSEKLVCPFFCVRVRQNLALSQLNSTPNLTQAASDMTHRVAVASTTVGLCLLLSTSLPVQPFTPPTRNCASSARCSRRIDDAENECTSSLLGDRPSHKSILNPITSPLSSRRSVLTASAAVLALLPLLSTASATAADPLEKLSIGSAKWNDPPDDDSISQSSFSPLLIDAKVVPPSFATYLARILLYYDDGASSWWGELSSSYSLLPSYEARKREGKAFGSFAYSIQRGIYVFVVGKDEDAFVSDSVLQERYLTLLEMLIENYGDKEGAKRQVGLLFGMLPASYQPTDALSKRCNDAIISKQATNNTERGKKSKLPLNFQEEVTSLLPEKYHLTYSDSTKSYIITPKANLFEIGVNEEAGTTAIATLFGPLSSQPLSRERPNLAFDVYALLGISGGAGCALTHTFVIPLDVVKTRMQTNPGQYDGIFDGATTIAKEEGVNALLLGTQATIVGYLWYGISVYPSYAFFKRFIGEQLLDAPFAVAHANDVALVAGALASVIASLGLTPIEACRIRAVAQPEIYRDKGLLGTMSIISGENDNLGWKNLYAGLPSLMTRQVIFGSVKFLAFERFSEAIFAAIPELKDATFTALGVSLMAGGLSGTLSSIVSQPADSVLTYVAKQSSGESLGILDGARMMVQKDGVGSLFRGLGSRCVWAGSIIAGQFLLYDVFRSLCGISGEDLNQVFEVVLARG